MAELFKILQPLQFLQTFLNAGARPDSRKFSQPRDVLVSCDCIDTADSSCLVKFGISSVICGIKTKMGKPLNEKPKEGILEINVRFACSNENDNPDRITISDYICECVKKVLGHAKTLDLEELCLIPNKYAWTIALEIICLDLDGSVVDLSLLAALGALKKCKLPKYEIDTEFNIITPTEQFERLQIKSFPILNTFVLIDNLLLIDPTNNEEELSDSIIRIAVDPNSSESIDSDSLYLLEITGSSEIDEKLLNDCYHAAMKRGKFLKNIIEQNTMENVADNSANVGSKF